MQGRETSSLFAEFINLGLLRFSFSEQNPISLSLIDEIGTLDEYKNAIKKDKKNLKYILDNVKEFQKEFIKEKGITSIDGKLQKLLSIITEKQKNTNKKVVIFSAYKDTVEYLFNQFKLRGFDKFAMVAGDENKVWNFFMEIKIEMIQLLEPISK